MWQYLLTARLINKEAFLSQQEDSLLETKPHGHGDVHLLLSQSGLVSKWH
jgi:UDP-N-acetylglucosamine pyrophosphorylase